MGTVSEYIWYLKFKNANLEQELESYKSGNKFKKLREDYEAVIRAKDREIKHLKEELAKSHAQTVTVRKYWNEIFDDVDAERKRAVLKAQDETRRAEEKALAAERKIDELTEKLKEERKEKYAIGAELEEAKNLNQKLTAQVNKDFENSSIPSSKQVNGRKKIPNSRERTGRKPGGQPGHKGHVRKKHAPTRTYEIPAPAKYTDSPDFYETGKIIRKQKVCIRLEVEVIEYTTKEYRNKKTGARVHAPFPKDYVNEVNYDGTVKALAFLLGNECGVSHGKIRKLLYELTDGKVEISDGMINGLCAEFSAKTEREKKEILKKLMTSPVMNVDFTNASVNGKGAQVLVLASPSENAALYIGREKKGHEGIRGTPLEGYVGTIVHDHDLTFYSYGTNHQECIQHDIRYLIGSRQNEAHLTWNGQMLELLRQMLHYRNGLSEDEELSPAVVSGFEAEYDRILKKAEEEYENEPPGDYYREGYNLFLRLRKYKENELLFLHDKRVPANNSLCERLARVYKRKQKQAVTLRSQENLCYICDGLSVVYLLRANEENVYHKISEIYGRRRPPKIKKEADAKV